MIDQVLGLKYPDWFHSLSLTHTTSAISPDLLSIWEDRISAVRESRMDSQVQPNMERWLTAWTGDNRSDMVERIAGMIRAPVSMALSAAAMRS